ncbi:MAG: tRNA pseudouridine(55) synthase TruB [Planctomycetota bacterium]
MTDDAPLAGLLLIDKPEGPTSMTVCRKVRRALVNAGAPKRVKVGHGGTLDPMATGLLVVLVGKATPLCDAIMQGTKRYLTTVDLSRTSTTDDREGETTKIESEPIERAQIEAVLPEFAGTIMQTPPAYSAMKVGGRRAYDLARRGEEVKLEPRPIRIDALKLAEYAWPLATLDVTCGKGTYIRSLGKDIGARLGVGGMLTKLRRTASGRFDAENAIKLDDLPESLTQSDLMVTEEVTDLLNRRRHPPPAAGDPGRA